MDAQIALILLTDGIANGAIYVLIGLGTVLIFSVTRVIFVPFGDIAALTALTVAAIQIGRLPGTVWLVSLLAAAAALMELALVVRQRRLHRLPMVLALYAVMPMLPVMAAVAVTSAGLKLPQVGQMLLGLALVVPVAPLLNRIVFEPLGSASVLVLLIVAVAPEGVRETEGKVTVNFETRCRQVPSGVISSRERCEFVCVGGRALAKVTQ